MLKLIFGQQALVGMDKQSLEFLRMHRDLFYVVPIDVKYDGQDISLTMFTKENSNILSEFHNMAKGADPRKFSISFPTSQKIRQELIASSMEKYDELVCLFPSETILADDFNRIEETVVQYAIGRQIDIVIANLHSISTSYSEYVAAAVNYLANWPTISAKIMHDELRLIERRKSVIQYLYVPDRKMVWDNGLKNYLKDKCFGLLNFADHRGMLITMDKRSYAGRLIKINPTMDDLVRIIKNGSNRILRLNGEKLVIHIHTSDESTLSMETRDRLAEICPDTSIIYGNDLDPVTAICAGHGAVLIELEKE